MGCGLRGHSGPRASGPQQEAFGPSLTGRSRQGHPSGAEASTGSPSHAPSPHSARRSTRCCVPTSPAGVSAPGAPSASCSTATRGASAGGQPQPRPRSPTSRPPGAGLPPATGPGDGDSGRCMCKRRVGGGQEGALHPAATQLCGLQTLKETSVQSRSSDLEASQPLVPRLGGAKGIPGPDQAMQGCPAAALGRKVGASQLPPPTPQERGGSQVMLTAGAPVVLTRCECGSPCG